MKAEGDCGQRQRGSLMEPGGATSKAWRQQLVYVSWLGVKAFF